MNITSDELQWVLEPTIYWLLAVEYQRDQVLKASKLDGKGSIFRTIGRMEEHFFLISCNKANRWLTKLDDSLMNPDNLDRLNQHLDKASFVRNKREHDEEYSGESPKAQPMYTVEEDGSGMVFNVSPGVTMFSGDRILLGGMLEVNECADSAALIRAELQGHQRLYWNNRNARAVELYCSPDRLIDLPEGG